MLSYRSHEPSSTVWLPVEDLLNTVLLSPFERTVTSKHKGRKKTKPDSSLEATLLPICLSQVNVALPESPAQLCQLLWDHHLPYTPHPCALLSLQLTHVCWSALAFKPTVFRFPPTAAFCGLSTSHGHQTYDHRPFFFFF
jgi:hypothetical protein